MRAARLRTHRIDAQARPERPRTAWCANRRPPAPIPCRRRHPQKPGNILFSADGQVKITDFGLSKIIEDSSATSMELTSQGAGTYWYLPPECFDTARRPKVSSKVDVWSAGVILYQMLFGRRPFAHSMSQESILRDDAIRKAGSLEFPDTPKVSQAAKDLITRCLIRDQTARPDMKMVVTDPYLDYSKLSASQLKSK